MDIDVVSRFQAILAAVAALGALALLVAALTARRSPTSAAIVRSVGPNAFLLGALVALGATLGSLYLSEVEGFRPCELCWYQRIAMYPLVVVLGVAAWRGRDATTTRLTTTVLAGIGGAIAAYHVWLQRFADPGSGGCDPDAPCTAIYLEPFGIFTIPTMALSGFAAILVLTWLPTASTGSADDADDAHDDELLATDA